MGTCFCGHRYLHFSFSATCSLLLCRVFFRHTPCSKPSGVRRGSRGGELGEFSPPSRFSKPPSFFFFFSSYPSNTSTRLWFYYIVTKIHPPFQNPGSAPGSISLSMGHSAIHNVSLLSFCSSRFWVFLFFFFCRFYAVLHIFSLVFCCICSLNLVPQVSILD